MARPGSPLHPSVPLIEHHAPRAWPAGTCTDLGGCTLRLTPGEPSRRANSALPNADDGAMEIWAKIDAVEAFYATAHQPPRFQITPLASPRDLDHALERRGYAVDAPTLILTTGLGAPRTRRPSAERFTVTLRDRVDDPWLAAWQDGQPGTSAGVTRSRILDRIEPATVYARASLDDRSAAVGLGVIEAGWLGIYCVATAPQMQRRGAATAVMAALLRSAAEHGADSAYLGVLEANEAARNLYEGLGFRTRYRYHYRWLPSGRARRRSSPGAAGR